MTLEKILETLLSLDSDDFTSDSCEKIAEYLRSMPREKIVELLDYITASLEKEIPEGHTDKVWIPVPYLVNKFQIHKRIMILCVLNHVLGEIDAENGTVKLLGRFNPDNNNTDWQKSYR